MWNVLVACRIWGKLWQGRCIHIYCDNMAVVQVLNSGKSRDQSLAVLNRNIWLECAIHDIELKISHIQGKVNVIADVLSRWQNSAVQWEKLLSVVPQPVWWQVKSEHLELNLSI